MITMRQPTDDDDETFAIPPRDDGAVSAPPKPCCARLRSSTGRQMWCALPDGHDGDHHGVSVNELPAPMSAHDPKRRPGWGR